MHSLDVIMVSEIVRQESLLAIKHSEKYCKVTSTLNMEVQFMLWKAWWHCGTLGTTAASELHFTSSILSLHCCLCGVLYVCMHVLVGLTQSSLICPKTCRLGRLSCP